MKYKMCMRIDSVENVFFVSALYLQKSVSAL